MPAGSLRPDRIGDRAWIQASTDITSDLASHDLARTRVLENVRGQLGGNNGEITGLPHRKIQAGREIGGRAAGLADECGIGDGNAHGGDHGFHRVMLTVVPFPTCD